MLDYRRKDLAQLVFVFENEALPHQHLQLQHHKVHASLRTQKEALHAAKSGKVASVAAQLISSEPHCVAAAMV